MGFRRPVNYFVLAAKATYWKGYWQFEGSLSKHFKNVRLNFIVNRLKGYEEYSIGLRYTFEFRRDGHTIELSPDKNKRLGIIND